MGHSLEWVASEVGVKPRRIVSWIEKGLLRGPGCGSRDGYSSEFVYAAKCVYQWLQLYPRGPLENLRDQMHPEVDSEDEAA